MMEKKPGGSNILTFFLLAAAAAFLFSCASQQGARRATDPILGQWNTNQNILLTLHRLPGSELVAEMTSAPGFYTKDLGAGSIIVRDIRPLSMGKYSGLLVMPGKEPPIKVRLRFSDTNTIVGGHRRPSGARQQDAVAEGAKTRDSETLNLHTEKSVIQNRGARGGEVKQTIKWMSVSNDTPVVF